MDVVTMGESFGSPISRGRPMGPDEPSPREMLISQYITDLASLEHTVAIHYRGRLLEIYRKINLCEAEIWNRQHGEEWRRPIMITSWKGRQIEPSNFQDVTMSDLHWAVEFFKLYPDSWRREMAESPEYLSSLSRNATVKWQSSMAWEIKESVTSHSIQN